MGYNYANALAELEPELSQVLTWAGTDYPCIIGARKETKMLGDGGYALDAGLEIVVRKSLFTDSIVPGLKDIITVGSRTLQVSTVLHDPGNEFAVLSCDDPTTGV